MIIKIPDEVHTTIKKMDNDKFRYYLPRLDKQEIEEFIRKIHLPEVKDLSKHLGLRQANSDRPHREVSSYIQEMTNGDPI